jgi:hypothetical protein
MGNKPFNIAVAVDEASPCQAGQTLSGKVFFDVRKAQEVAQFTSINLQILGSESSEMGTTRLNDKCSVNILQVDFALVRLSNTEKGQYEFPFQWPIPATLPGAIKCSDIRNKKSFCEIRYTLTAYLATSGAAVVPENPQLVSTVTLPIQGASPTTRPEPQTMPTEFFSMDSFCLPLCGQSSMEVGWTVDKPMASPGQEVVVQCWCDNRSKRDVDHVTAKWVESISWRSGPNLSYAKSTTRNLAQQRLAVTADSQWQPVLFPGRGNKRGGGNNTSVSMMGPAEPLTFTLNLPEDAVDSYSGQLLQVRHLLVLTVHTPGFQTSSPELACPVAVVRPFKAETSMLSIAPQAYEYENLPVAQGLALPDNWNAVASEVVTIPEATAVVVLTDQCVAPPDPSVAKTDTTVSSNAVTSAAAAAAPTDVIAMASAPDETLLYDHDEECFSGEPDLNRLRDMAVNYPSKIPEALQKDSRWTALVQDFTPREYSSFVLLARNDGPSVARSLAVSMGVNFECRHILACLWSLPDSNRMNVLREVASLASDLTTNRSSIENELDPTELAEFCGACPISAVTTNAEVHDKKKSKTAKSKASQVQGKNGKAAQVHEKKKSQGAFAVLF